MISFGMAKETRRDFTALEQRRRRGMEMLAEGVAQAKVAQRLGVTSATVCKWNGKRAQGAQEWKRRPLGRPVKVTTEHRRQLTRILKQGARAYGFMTDLWTLPRIAAVLARETGVRVHPGHLWRILGATGRAYSGRRSVPRSATRRRTLDGNAEPSRR